MSSPSDYDVVVLGGGPAGCATALALRQLGVRAVLVVEARCYDTERVGEGIPPDTRVLLQRLAIWEDFLKEGHDPCLGSCSSWGSHELGYNDFLFNPLGNGWHLERKRFDAFLADRALHSGAELRVGTQLRDCEPIDKGYRLHLTQDNGNRSTAVARFVVDATGTRSTFARWRGAMRQFVDRLICVYGFFECADGAEFSRLTMLESVEYGWWYAARLPNGRVAAAVLSDAEIIKRARLRKPDTWLAWLAQTHHLAKCFVDYRFLPDRQLVCAAPSFILDRAVGDRWLAVGDAASAYDPISAQGIYKSLHEGLDAAEGIRAALAGNASALADYQASVRSRFASYLEVRNYFYGLERRWASSPFWRRRQQRNVAHASWRQVPTAD